MRGGPGSAAWQIDGETMERVTDFIWGDSKITTDGDCSHEIKRRLLLGRKVRTPLASRVVHGVSGPLSNCVWNLQVFPDDSPQ